MSSRDVQRTLRAAVQNREFAPAYYLHGDDDFLKEDAVRQLVAAAVDPATRDFNLELRRGPELSGETLGSLLATPPMMAERRMVVVRDAGGLKKDARTALDRYLTAPAPDTVLLLVSPAGAKPDKRLLERTTELCFAPLTGDRVPKWITHHAKTALGVEISEGAVALLQAAAGTDLPMLALELEKLASYTGGGAIDEAAVSAVVGVRPDETLGSLLDAVATRDAVRALALLPGVLQQPKTSGVTVVMALATQFLAIGWAQAARARGVHPGRLAGELFNLLKASGSTYTGRPWGEAVSAWVKAHDRWTPDAVDAALEALLEADHALKDTRASSDEQLLASLILALCGSGVGAARSAA